MAKPPLYWAAWAERSDTALMLIEKGADIEAKGEDGKTALIAAAGVGLSEVALKLIEKGADIEAKDKNGNTSLIWAVRAGLSEVVLKLIEKGADIEAKDKDGRTPLMWADKEEHSDIVSAINKARLKKMELERREAEAEAKSVQEPKPVIFSRKDAPKELNELILVLIQKDDATALLELINSSKYSFDREIADENGNNCTLLMHAAEQGSEKVVQALLENKAEVNKPDSDGDTALTYAVDCEEENQLNILQLLLKSGADPTIKNNEQETPLDRAKENNANEEVINQLEESLSQRRTMGA